MIALLFVILLIGSQCILCLSWNISDGILPWEAYIPLRDIERPLGLTLNRTSLAHHHFAIGYFCLHSFMYDEAHEAFDLAINATPTFLEPYIGKMLGCKHPLWKHTDFDCGLSAYNTAKMMIKNANLTLTPLQTALISTVYQWYADRSSIPVGEDAFLSSIANISKTHPNENDIRVLWGLALLNIAYEHPFEAQMEPKPMLESREVLKDALQSEPNHPGALHYIIQTYDLTQASAAEQVLPYVSAYKNLNISLTYPQHLPALVWMHIGSLVFAKYADDASVRASLTLCSTKVLGYNTSVSSTELQLVLDQMHTGSQISAFLRCDDANRATSTEWLAFSRLQTGNWIGTLSSLVDLYLAYKQSFPPSNLYLSTAYRTRARVIINLLYWLPYDTQFISRAQEVYELDHAVTFIPLGDDITDTNLAWSEAGYRFSECLRLLIATNNSYSDSTVKSTINDHLARFAVLANHTASLNQFISKSIAMMIDQVHGIIYYKNDSYQECLMALNNATQQEFHLLSDIHSPNLLFARSSELLAMHLLLIHRKYLQSSKSDLNRTFILNGTNVSINEFPQRAFDLYEIGNSSAPNRAINILGKARSYAQLLRNDDAARIYRMLINQITSTNTSDPVFSDEAANFLTQKKILYGSASTLQFYFSSFFLILLIFITQ